MGYKHFVMIVFVITSIICLLAWYLAGRYYVPDLEDEDYYVYFLKSKHGFLFEFENPLVMFPEQRRRLYQDSKGYSSLALYCQYRYGFEGTLEQIINQCRKYENIDALNE